MNKKKNIKAITVVGTGIERRILSDIEITDFFTHSSVVTMGIWDSGATGSVVTKSVAQSLNLKPIGQRTVRGVHGTKQVNLYYVILELANTDIRVITEVTECDELSADHSIGMLIGMNIITKGDFTISNYRGKTAMSFRVPSKQRTDYTK